MFHASGILLCVILIFPSNLRAESPSAAPVSRAVNANLAKAAADKGAELSNQASGVAKENAKKHRDAQSQKEKEGDQAGAEEEKKQAEDWEEKQKALDKQETAFKSASASADMAYKALALSPEEASQAPFLQGATSKAANAVLDNQATSIIKGITDPLSTKFDSTLNNVINSIPDQVASTDLGSDALNSVRDTVASRLDTLSQQIQNPVQQAGSLLTDAIKSAPQSVRQQIGAAGAAAPPVINSPLGNLFKSFFAGN